MSKDKMKYHTDSSDDLMDFLKNKAQNHNHYKLYTSIDRIENMLEYNALFLTNGSKWNDLVDRENLNSQKYDVINYANCFSFSKSESVAMWMLYGGNDGKGAMIDFSKGVLKSVLKQDEIVLGRFEEKVFKKEIELTPNDYEIELIDILYVGEDEKAECYTIKRSDERVKEVKKNVVDAINQQKGYAWAYENECRLIVSVNRDKVPNVNFDVVKITFDYEKKKLRDRVYHSPNIGINARKYKNSTLQTRMDWDLCRDCKSKGGASCQSS